MTDWQIRLVSREQIADQTMAFYFEKPQGLAFAAGQFVDLTLIDPPETDWEGTSRTLTIASAPFEERLMFAMRMRDTAFKRVLQTLPLGRDVMIDDPAGAFTLHQDSSRAAIFLAAGIGVTPFRSMIRQAIHDRLPHRLFLFYSNRRPEDASFLDEIRNLEAESDKFKFIPTMTQLWRSKTKWPGETGYLGSGLIARHVGSLDGPIYYIAGPPAMIEGMRQKLRDVGVKRDDINADSFDGY